MRVLIAVHGFPPTHYAGAERAAERIVHWLVNQGHEVEVFTLGQLDAPDTHLDTASKDGYVIHRLHYDLKEHAEFQHSYDHPAVGKAFESVLSKSRFDVVHIISGYLLGGQIIHLAKSFGIPVVITLTEYWFMCSRLNLLQSNGALCSGPETDEKCARCLLEEKRRFRLPSLLPPALADHFWSATNHRLPVFQDKIRNIARRRQMLREALNAADTIISPSRFLICKFAEYGFDTARSVYIRHGLTPTIPISSPQPRTFHPGKTLRLGYIGQIKHHKGTDLLVDAVLPLLDDGLDIRLEIWGPEDEAPDYAARLRRRTRDHPAIQWKGRYDASQVWDILSGFDALVISSRWYENSPTVITEAFTAGLPVIAANLGGMAELVEHEKSGLLFELNNADDLRRQIHRLTHEPELLHQLRDGIPATKTAEEEVAEIFEQYLKVVVKV